MAYSGMVRSPTHIEYHRTGADNCLPQRCTCRSISIACWIVVFTPQIIVNFRRASAEGLSIVFLVVWLAGDVFNVLGAVLQGVLPTMASSISVVSLPRSSLRLPCIYRWKFRDYIQQADRVINSAQEDHFGSVLHFGRYCPYRSMLLLSWLYPFRPYKRTGVELGPRRRSRSLTVAQRYLTSTPSFQRLLPRG